MWVIERWLHKILVIVLNPEGKKSLKYFKRKDHILKVFIVTNLLLEIAIYIFILI